MFFTFAPAERHKTAESNLRSCKTKKAVFYSLFVFIVLPSKIHNINSLCIATTALTIQ